MILVRVGTPVLYETGTITRRSARSPRSSAEPSTRTETRAPQRQRTMADDEGATKSYEERAKHVSVISKPLAGKKLTKKVYKVVKKAAKAKAIKRGVKEVVKGLRKGSKGVCIIAGDISPIDVISHLPVLCEESDVPYIFVPSKVDLGAAGQTKRPTSCTLVCTGGADVDGLDEVLKEVTAAKPVY